MKSALLLFHRAQDLSPPKRSGRGRRDLSKIAIRRRHRDELDSSRATLAVTFAQYKFPTRDAASSARVIRAVALFRAIPRYWF